MGLLDFIFGRKKRKKQLQLTELEKEKFDLPPNIRSLSDSEKVNLILQGVHSIYDELRPMDSSGARVSRLSLIMEQLPQEERAQVKKKIEELDIDELILEKLKEPMAIKKLSKELKKSYGYTAARLRELKKSSKVTRKRDPETNRFVYMRLEN